MPTASAALPALFSSMGIKKVTRNDKFSIDYADDLMTVRVLRQGGQVETIRKKLGAGFQEVMVVTPENVNKENRDELILQLLKERMTQEQIARRIGVSQSTISNVLHRHQK